MLRKLAGLKSSRRKYNTHILPEQCQVKDDELIMEKKHYNFCYLY